MSMLTRLLLSPVDRRDGRAPNASIDSPARASVHTVCDEQEESRVRTLLTWALTGPDVDLLDLHTRQADPGSAALEAIADLHGPAVASLGRVLTLVWLDPGVRAIRWRLSPTPRP